MTKLYVEICSSCLRACELTTNKQEAQAIADQIKNDLNHSCDGALVIEVGQCQRFCPPDRITVSMGLDAQGKDRRLGASQTGSVESLREFISSKITRFLVK